MPLPFRVPRSGRLDVDRPEGRTQSRRRGGAARQPDAARRYPFIDRHHFIHHVDMEANVNFLLPLADWCYGTLRTTLTAAEIAKHGTLEEAKATPVGHSEPAAVFAAGLLLLALSA